MYIIRTGKQVLINFFIIIRRESPWWGQTLPGYMSSWLYIRSRTYVFCLSCPVWSEQWWRTNQSREDIEGVSWQRQRTSVLQGNKKGRTLCQTRVSAWWETMSFCDRLELCARRELTPRCPTISLHLYSSKSTLWTRENETSISRILPIGKEFAQMNHVWYEMDSASVRSMQIRTMKWS